MIRAAVCFLRLLPAALERAHLEWALREIDPMHDDIPYIVRRINQLARSA